MIRILPASILLLTAVTVHAQHLDSLATSPPDSINSLQPHLIRDPTIRDYIPLPSFTTIQPALSRIAGVQVTPYSGAPGAWATVRIRGVANLTGNSQPLYVVDGVPVYNTEIIPEQWTSGYNFYNSRNQSYTAITTPFTPSGNPLLDMPVEDVEFIEVVKGAAATARYGMQGANGVIRISTRRGADGKSTAQALRVRYAGWGGLQQVRQRYALLTAREYAQVANQAATNNKRTAVPYSPADLRNLGEVDWQDKLFRTAAVQDHNVSFDGFTGRTRYYVAADYLQQSGVLINSNLSRYSLRANVEQQLTSRLNLALRASGSRLDQQQPGFEPDAAPLLNSALLAVPAVPARNEYGNMLSYEQIDNTSRSYRKPRTYRLMTQLMATYTFSPDLTLSARGSFEQADARAPFYHPAFSYFNSDYSFSHTEAPTTHTHNWVTDAALRYQHTFAERHSLIASLSHLQQKYEHRYSNRQNTYVHDRNSPQPDNPAQHSTQSYWVQWMPTLFIQSSTATFTYVYDKRYEVQASLRSDFHFGKAKRNIKSDYHWFPGAELRWHLGQEKFLADFTSLSDFTLYAGVGHTSSYFNFENLERTKQQEAGVRLAFLGNRLTVDASIYQRYTEITQNRIELLAPMQTGATTISLYPNLGLRNRGAELSVTGTWQLGALRGISTVAAATNRNQIENFTNQNGSNARLLGLENGHSIARFLTYEQLGTYPASSAQAGQRRFRDLNNDGQIDYSDARYQGSGLPRYSLNIVQQLSWRRFQLDAQFDGLFGYQLFNSTLTNLDSPTGLTNNSKQALNYWTPTNQNTFTPQPGNASAAAGYRSSNQALASGNHVRLSQLMLNYEVLNTSARRMSVWVGGQNLFVTGSYRGFDPNVSSGGASPMQAGQDAAVYPVARVWQLGVRATL